MGSRARDDKKFTDEEIFTARIVEEGIVLAAEERFKRILPRQRDTRTGFKRILPRRRDTWIGLQTDTTRSERHTDGSHTDPMGMETQYSLGMRAHKTIYPTSRQGGAPHTGTEEGTQVTRKALPRGCCCPYTHCNCCPLTVTPTASLPLQGSPWLLTLPHHSGSGTPKLTRK